MKIFIAKNPAEAHIVCELLKTEDICCEVRGEGLFGLKGELPFGDDTDPYVWLLDPEQQSKAHSIIEAFRQQSQSNIYEDWQCPHCLEHNEGQFGACWQCGYQMGEP
ncbi:hypothetical protein PO80_17710 [Vibrio parahaemolyticus]|uniref:putative signal transducing protein n=1 Tax=Vibrio parahaemolyticus TaxID=670 RepID=UPI00054386C9|nr:DUF2007 domain-containing protein [Vibrio parahaemolyticus]KHF13795.1 hypothetical protein PO80_17710 [Vibrio parahaemolyticus]MBE3885051.1 DUF2007 domain-containing protein [Vibrio parahaemolyticus]OTW00378.1 hypothetical protein BA739_02890 [Vibrio parahaemolyticus]OTW04867.1 hypothetical protein BA740_02935 [Vibrio parahaemolyticus]TNY64412.1 hypothetical protein CGK67_04155 [Vibrio parahaemolyticus]